MNNPDVESPIPPFVGPHEGREFDLMMSGFKHLAMFSIEGEEQSDNYPDPRFEMAVTEGIFVKSSYVVTYTMPDGSELSELVIMYAHAAEEWRISAMQVIKEIYARMGSGWRPDLERVIGYLLGYDDKDVELFIERLFRIGAFIGPAYLDAERTHDA